MRPHRLLPLCGVLVALAGCSAVKIENDRPDGAHTSTRAWVPAWPWQDSRQVIERLTLSARTNSFTASFRGEQEQTTSTNAASLVQDVVSAAVGAAIKAARP